MDLLIEFIKISKALKAKLSSAGRNSLRFKRIVCKRADDGAFPTEILTLIFAGFLGCYPLESFKIICLACIWLNKASFFANAATNQCRIRWPYFQVFQKSLREDQNTVGAGTRHIIG